MSLPLVPSTDAVAVRSSLAGLLDWRGAQSQASPPQLLPTASFLMQEGSKCLWVAWPHSRLSAGGGQGNLSIQGASQL